MNYKIFYRTKWILLSVFSILLSLFAKLEKVTAQEIQETLPIITTTKYSEESVLLVLFIVVLMAILFLLLFNWSDRSDKTSYLGTLYKDTITEVEYKRLKAIVQEKWDNKGYYEEVLLNSEKAKQDGFDIKIPLVSRDLPIDLQIDAYKKINRYKMIFGITREEDLTPFEEIPYQPRDPNLINPRERINSQHSEKDLKLYNDFCDTVYEWALYVGQQAKMLYTADQSKAREKAEKRAEKAIAINWSVLKGRGTEFVLEFTTVVVIIFAAIILGILRILDTQQIGTLLAAIAGYVLGRATTRSQNEAGEVKKSETVTE